MNRKRLSRRTYIQATGIAALTGLAGCTGVLTEDKIKDTDGDGVIDSEDYAPRDPDVQRAEQVKQSDEDTDCETPDDSETTSSGESGKYEIVEENLMPENLDYTDRSDIDGEWYTMRILEDLPTVKELYIKFHPGDEDEAVRLLEFHKQAVPATKEELPYDFEMDAIQYYLYEGRESTPKAISGGQSGAIHMPIKKTYQNAGYGESAESFEEGYQMLTTHEWAGVIIYAIQSRKDGYFDFPNWFPQGFEQVISEDFNYQKDVVLKAVEKGEIPPLSDAPYRWGLWSVYYLQVEYGRYTPEKITKTPGDDFGAALKEHTGRTPDQFESDFQDWMLGNMSAEFIQKVNDSAGTYKVSD